MTLSEAEAPHAQMLGALCYLYQHLLSQGAVFAEATQAEPERDIYWLIDNCINPGTAKFAKYLPTQPTPTTLCEDLLRRWQGLLNAELPGDAPLLPAFETWRQTALANMPDSFPPLPAWASLGEQLSAACYQQVYAATHPNLVRPVEVTIQARNQQKFYSLPDKAGGTSRVFFEFALPQFDVESFANLPFYFFHEYFSHLHSAPMRAEAKGAVSAFEDGWLLYAAHAFYCAELAKPTVATWPWPDHSRYFVDNYIYKTCDDPTKRTTRRGYDLAQHFDERAAAVFWPLTLKIAFTPYTALPGGPDVQLQFLEDMVAWLKRPAVAQAEGVELLTLALAEDDLAEIMAALRLTG